MNESTDPNAQKRRRNDLIRIYFCRKLLSENFLSSSQLYPGENVENDRHPDTPLSNVVDSPMEMNGTATPIPESNSLQRLLNQHSDALTLRLENSIMTPKTWNCGVYSPIEVCIDSPSAIDNSEQASTLLSTMSDDVSTASDLFEMDVLERINRLRRQGKWSLTRLPLCLDAPRPKTHMDYFLEECMMMQTDFVMERETKRLAAKMLAYEAKQYVQQKRKNNVINLCRTSNNTRKQSSSSKKGRQNQAVDELISSLPVEYIGDLRSRLTESSNELFKEFLNSKIDKWDLMEKVCNKISSTKPKNGLLPEGFNPKLRNFAGTLRPYQIVALKWFINAFDNSFGCILSDDEKLGKKIEVLSFLGYLEEYRKISGPHLIVTDEAANWTIALERFLPNAKILEFSDQKDNISNDFQICLIDYETYFSDLFTSTFGSSFFQVQIIDKAESLEFFHEKPLDYLFEENPLHGDYRFRILLGNCGFLENAFGQQKFVPTLLLILQLLLPKSIQTLFGDKPNEEEIEKLLTKNLLSFLQSFQLSRTKVQVSDQIPSSSLEIVKCKMTSKQHRLYGKLLKLPRIKQELASNKPIQAMDIFRKLCSHPLLIDNQPQIESSLIVSLYHPILRRAFLDFEEGHLFCQQLCLQKSFSERIKNLQSVHFSIVRQGLESLAKCSLPNLSNLYFHLYPLIARSIFNFVGRYDCSPLTIWQRNRSKQLANELFFKRSSREDNILSINCLCLLDKSRLLLNSGKLQELFKIVAKVRKRQQRCIIFTSYESTQALLCEALAYHKFTYMILSDQTDRKEFLDTFNKNQRIACVLVSTRNSLYRLNLNNIGAVVMLETDWEIEYNDNIKRFYTKFIQSSGAGFYNLVSEESLELRTNLFEVDVKPNLLDISRSITNETLKKGESRENLKSHQSESDLQKDITLTEFTLPYAAIYCEMDDGESVSNTLSTSGYEGSLDDNTSLHAEPLTYDRNFLESDSYLSSVFGLNWRYNLNNQDKYGFTEETQMFDSFSNPWYTGEIIEPDEIEYTKMSPPEQQMDEDTLFEYGDEQENNYIDSRALSPKSTDDLIDLSTPPASAEASRMSTEFSLDPAIQMQTQRPAVEQDESRFLKKTAQRLQSRSDELRRKLLETQAIVLPDPEQLFRPDGKSGYMPPRSRNEWVDADSPSWTYIEDHALLALTIKQLCAIPIPSYISRSFCVNWNLIAFNMDKVSFQKRTPNQCCTRFRELIAKKFAPVESPSTVVEQFDELDLSLLNDERVVSSVQYSTRCFNRSIATLARKLEDLKRIRNTWQARTNWLNSCDDDEHFDILKRLTNRGEQALNNALNSTRIRRLMNNSNSRPSEILTVNKKSLPLDMVMVYHQYSRGIRLSRVLTTAKSFMVKALKGPVDFGRIPAYAESISFNNRRIFVIENDKWKIHVVSSAFEFNHHSHKVPKIQQPIESRLLWVDQKCLAMLDRKLDLRIYQLLQSKFMQYTVDIRSNMTSSQELTFEIVQIASKFILPKMPKRAKNVKKVIYQVSVETSGQLLDDVKHTLKNSDYRLMRNGNSLLPIRLENFPQNDLISYSPLLLPLSSEHQLKADILPFFLAKFNENLKNGMYSISEQFEDLLLNYQDSLYQQTQTSTMDCRLFAKKSPYTSLILKIGKRPSNKKISSNKYVISCVPGDHFEIHNLKEEPIIQSDNMKNLIATLESNIEDKRMNSILTTHKHRQTDNSMSYDANVNHSHRLQRQIIQKYVDENLHKSSLEFLPKDFDYKLQIRELKKNVKNVRKRRQFEEDLAIPSISRLDEDFLISFDASSKNSTEFYAQIDERISNEPIKALLTCAKSTNEGSSKINPKIIEEICQQMQSDEGCINVQNLKAINQIFKLSRKSLKFEEAVNVEFDFKLPRPTVDELLRIRQFMKNRFIENSKPIFNNSRNNELDGLINKHCSKFLAELKHYGGENLKKSESLSTIALKLKLNNSTPQFSNILPINSSKFDVEYVKNGRVLRLRYQSAVQVENFNLITENGNLSFDVECKRSETNKSSKSEIDHISTCLALEKPTTKAILINSLMKMSNLERQQWLDTLKHRYLRITNLQHKQKALKSIEKMHKTIDQILKENNQILDKNDQLTEAESKKMAIKKLIVGPETKFPTSLENVKHMASNFSTIKSTQLADILIQTAAKSQLNICEKLHPTFTTVDSLEKWKDREDVLKIDYKDANKILIVFDKALENFYNKLKHPSIPIENNQIESNEDVYDHLLGRSEFGPSKIIKFRTPAEIKDPKQSIEPTKQEQQVFDGNSQNFEQNQSTSNQDYSEGNSQNDPNRERSLPTIPSAMQVPASAVYHLKTDNPMSQSSKTSMDQVYYTKRNPSISGSSDNSQRQIQLPELNQQSLSAPPSVHDNFRKDMFSKNPPNRQIVRQVVVGNRQKNDQQNDSYENRFYQTPSGQRELTVREKLQRDLAMGVVQTSNQKKLYPVRIPTNMKRKLSENQSGSEEVATKRGRSQYVYQVKNNSGNVKQSNISLNNQSEQQQTTSQTVPMIFHHGEPIKTYIRRENHQFAIHEPNYQQRLDTQPPDQPLSQKSASQLKVYEKRSTPTTTNSNNQQTTLSKSRNELLSNAEKPSNST